MDGLSAAASIIAVLQLAASVVKYINAAAGATEDRKRLREEIRSCEYILQQLNDKASDTDESKAWVETIKALEAPGAPLGRLRIALLAVEKPLQPREGLRKLISNLKWPFTEKDVDKILVTIDREKTLLGIALTNNCRKLLTEITATSKENKRQLAELLEAIGKNTLLLESTEKLVIQMGEDISHVKTTVSLLEQRTGKAEELAELSVTLEWLSPLDFAETHADLLHKKRLPGTGTWITRDSTFRSWLDRSSSNRKNTELALSGDPGSGKSILCSIMIDHVQTFLGSRPDSALCNVYGLYQDRGSQSAENVVGAIVKQLAFQCPGVASKVVSAYKTKTRGSAREVKKLVEMALHGACSLSSVYLFIDGLDEMQPDTLSGLEGFVKAFQNKKSGIILHLVLSGRRYAVEAFSPSYIRTTISIEAKKEDVKALVKGRFLKNARMRLVADGDLSWQGRIVAGITNKAMAQSAPFPLAYCYVNRVAEEVTKADVIQAVAGLVQPLPDYLDETLHRIRQSAPEAKLAFHTFAWLLAARTTLSAEQLCEALAVNTDDKRLLRYRKPRIQLITDVCKGLVIVKGDNETVEFFHHTVMEHLSTQPELAELTQSVPRNSLHYMLYDDFTTSCETIEEIERRRNRYPLAAYLSVFWPEHLRGEHEKEFEDQIVHLLTSPAMLSNLQLLPPAIALESRVTGHLSAPKPETWWDCDKVALSLAVHFGLRSVTKRLLATNHDVNFAIPQGQHYTPLHGAVYRADVGMAEELINGKAKLDLQDTWGLTPLHLAVTLSEAKCRLDIVRLLCHAGARLSIPDQDGDLALHAAAAHADVDTIKCLLEQQPDVNATNNRRETALHYVIRRAMFREGSNSTAEGADSLSSTDVIICVKILMDAGADGSIVDANGNSPFDAAIRLGVPKIISCILESSRASGCPWVLPPATVDTAESALKSAAWEETNKALLGGWTYLQHSNDSAAFAVRKGDTEWLLQLIQKRSGGVDKLWQYRMLHEAIWARRAEVAVLLLALGAPVEAKNNMGRDARDLAKLLGDQSMIDLLDGGWKDERVKGKPALHWKLVFEEARRKANKGFGRRDEWMDRGPLELSSPRYAG